MLKDKNCLQLLTCTAGAGVLHNTHTLSLLLVGLVAAPVDSFHIGSGTEVPCCLCFWGLLELWLVDGKPTTTASSEPCRTRHRGRLLLPHAALQQQGEYQPGQKNEMPKS